MDTATVDRLAVASAIDCLGDGVLWPAAAAKLLADSGFLLIEAHPAAATAGLPGGSLRSHLVVALRDRPSLRHFDPEELAYYAPTELGAETRSVSRASGADGPARIVSWGHVHVIDRIPVENRFLTFGGELRLSVVDASLTVADLRSPVPIVRWGGHSQGTDGLAEAIGAFFGRLIVPVDFVPGAAARIDSVSPEVLFTAFVADAVRRQDAAPRRTEEPSALDRWLRAASAWLRPNLDWRTRADALLAELPSG